VRCGPPVLLTSQNLVLFVRLVCCGPPGVLSSSVKNSVNDGLSRVEHQTSIWCSTDRCGARNVGVRVGGPTGPLGLPESTTPVAVRHHPAASRSSLGRDSNFLVFGPQGRIREPAQARPAILQTEPPSPRRSSPIPTRPGSSPVTCTGGSVDSFGRRPASPPLPRRPHR